MARFPVPFPAAALVALAGLSACAGPLGPGDPGLVQGGVAYGRDYRSAPPYAPAPPRGRGGPAFAEIGYATWQDDEPEYRLYPGDVLDVSVLSAPELNRTVTVQPDGRVTLPLVPSIMVADRSPLQAEQAVSAAYAAQLVRPDISISVKQATPLKVFVGGEVDKPGVYDMPGDINALQAVIMAGGFRNGARRDQVVVLRRGFAGQAMMRTADLRRAARTGLTADAVPLRRFDVVYVPRTGLADLGVFVSQVRDTLPFQFSYVIGGQYVTSR